jgi:Trk K+ transport system NAD-binding subunit
MATTFRNDIVDGIMTVLNAYIAANPTRLVRAYRSKPLNVAAGDLPSVYVDVRNEDIRHSEGTRTRVMSPSVVVVDRATDNIETGDRMDPLIDGLVDAFTATPQLMTGTVWDRMTIRDVPIEIGEYEYAGVRITIPDVTIREGRD